MPAHLGVEDAAPIDSCGVVQEVGAGDGANPSRPEKRASAAGGLIVLHAMHCSGRAQLAAAACNVKAAEDLGARTSFQSIRESVDRSLG